MSTETRAHALDLACRLGPLTGAKSTGDVLSTARMFDKFLTTGITRYGKHDDRVQLDAYGHVHVIVDVTRGSVVDPEILVDPFKAAVLNAVTS